MSKVWVRRVLVALSAYTLLRVVFLALNWGQLSLMPLSTVLFGFIQGLRFDAAMIATLNIPIIVLQLVSRAVAESSWMATSAAKVRWNIRFDRLFFVMFCLVNVPFLVIGTVDAQLFMFTGRRTSPDSFAIAGDILHQSLPLFLQYWWLTLLGILLILMFVSASWIPTPRPKLRMGSWQKHFWWIAWVGFGVVVVRGGMQRKPLVPAHAYLYQPPVFANLILNSTITMLRSSSSERPPRYDDFGSVEEAKKILRAVSDDGGLPHVPLIPGRNVVILIVESLAAEYVGKLNNGIGYTPFLDSLMAESVVFESSFANGRRSIDALPAIFASIPAWRDEPFVTSAFSGNRIDALPRLLRAQGYQTYFFHGAFNGSMHFDVFSSIAGIEHYVGMSQYQAAVGDDRNYDGQWGIFDEPFLQFVLKTIDRSKRPFMAGAFTLSSHNPFRIPSEYKGKFPKGTLPIHQSIGYADHALKSFFDAAKSKNWYRDTVFVITGDHTSLTDQPSYDNALGRFRVPIFIFDPMGTLPKIGNGKIAQHVDITPTLLDLLGLSSEHQVAFGSSLFSPGYQGRFLQHEYGSWYYLDHQALVKFDERDGHARFYRPTDALFSKTLPNEEIQNGQFHSADKLQILKAARQYFFNGMLDNSW